MQNPAGSCSSLPMENHARKFVVSQRKLETTALEAKADVGNQGRDLRQYVFVSDEQKQNIE